MSHDHTHHHDAATGTGRRALVVSLILNAAYTALQATVGLLAGSVALLADAGHNLSDVLALAVALVAVWFAARPATPRRSFGYRRAEILAALANALSIVAIAGIILVEAIRRLDDPPEVPGAWLMLVAAGGIAINAGSALLIHRANRDRENLNLRASFLHLAGDALASVGVLIAGALVVAFDWTLADPIIAIAIAGLIAISAWGVLKESVLVLLEAAPKGIDPEQIGAALASTSGVADVHDLHVWSLSSDFPALSAHVVVEADQDCHRVRRELEHVLANRFDIHHSTLQTDHRQPRLLMPGQARDTGCDHGREAHG